MASVYALMDEGLVLYVGSTIQILKERKWVHRSKGNDCSSRHIPKDCEWVMTLLESCSVEEMIMREQYYYDTLKPLYNERRPGQTWKEYKQSDAYKEYVRLYEQTDARKESKRLYDQTDARKEYMRRYIKARRAAKKAANTIE